MNEPHSKVADEPEDLAGCIGKVIDDLKRENIELRDKAELYEVVRRMNPQQFADAWKLNISWGKPFDEIIRDLKPFYLKGVSQ